MLLALLERLAEAWRSLRRFYVFRRYFALGLSLLLTTAARPLIGAPPEGFWEWPSAARGAASGLVEGAFSLGTALMVGVFVSLAVWVPWRPLRIATMGVGGFLAISLGVHSVQEFVRGVISLTELPAPGVARVLEVVACAVLAPTAIGSAPLLWFYATEWVTLFPLYRRLFKTGMGPAGGWLAPPKMRRYVRPVPGGWR